MTICMLLVLPFPMSFFGQIGIGGTSFSETSKEYSRFATLVTTFDPSLPQTWNCICLHDKSTREEGFGSMNISCASLNRLNSSIINKGGGKG